MAEFAANAAQGHIGRAKYLATNEEARKTREKILNIPFTVNDLASAFEAANMLVELAKSQALAESVDRDEAELAKLKESYGTTGSKLSTGGSKAVKELEKEQKTRASRLVKDFLLLATIDIETIYLNELIENSNSHEKQRLNLEKATNIEEFKKKFESNTSIQIAIESLFCSYLSRSN
jgi:DNA polymerase-3 subunit delta'